METATCYICSHCRKIYRREKTCAWHEKYCSSNPANHFACLNECAHLCAGRDEHGRKHFTCQVDGKKMYTHVALRRRLEIEKGLVLMPMECVHYTSNIDEADRLINIDDIKLPESMQKIVDELFNSGLEE
jgi:hypothetical protein